MVSKVSVFCASSNKIAECYFQAVEELGILLARNNVHVYYGGGEVGLMGRLANTILKNKGKITGIIPSFMVEQGWAHPEVEHIIVRDMHERKKLLAQHAEAIIALPGGVGTMEELLEMITLKQLGKILVPVIILNTNGFFTPLLEFFESLIRERFMRDIHRDIWSVVSFPTEVPAAIENAPVWDGSKIKYAPA